MDIMEEIDVAVRILGTVAFILFAWTIADAWKGFGLTESLKKLFHRIMNGGFSNWR